MFLLKIPLNGMNTESIYLKSGILNLKFSAGKPYIQVITEGYIRMKLFWLSICLFWDPYSLNWCNKRISRRIKFWFLMSPSFIYAPFVRRVAISCVLLYLIIRMTSITSFKISNKCIFSDFIIPANLTVRAKACKQFYALFAKRRICLWFLRYLGSSLA